MAAWQQILCYGRERGFLARARADAAERFPPEWRIVERNAAHHRDGEFERAAAVYVESVHADIADGYRARGALVLTDVELEEGARHAGHAQAQEGGAREADVHSQGEGPRQDVANPIPITAGRRRRRSA